MRKMFICAASLFAITGCDTLIQTTVNVESASTTVEATFRAIDDDVVSEEAILQVFKQRGAQNVEVSKNDDKLTVEGDLPAGVDASTVTGVATTSAENTGANVWRVQVQTAEASDLLAAINQATSQREDRVGLYEAAVGSTIISVRVNLTSSVEVQGIKDYHTVIYEENFVTVSAPVAVWNESQLTFEGTQPKQGGMNFVLISIFAVAAVSFIVGIWYDKQRK